MHNNKEYTYIGGSIAGIATGARVLLVADATTPSHAHIRAIVSKQTATVPKKHLHAGGVTSTEDMANAEDMAAMLSGLKDAMDNARPVCIAFAGADGQLRTAMYSQSNAERISLISGVLYNITGYVQAQGSTEEVRTKSRLATMGLTLGASFLPALHDLIKEPEAT